MRQLLYTMFISNNRTSFHLWRKENLIKNQKVSKCYENDCGWWDAPFMPWDLPVSNLYATYTPIAIPITPSPLLLPPETRPGYTLTHQWVTNFISLKPQYEPSHQKQDSLITTSKISNFLLQLYIVKSTTFTLNQPAITNSRHSHTLLRRVFSSLRPRKNILNPFSPSVPLINIRNKKMKSLTHPAPPTLE